MPSPDPGSAPLTRLERLGLALLGLAVVGFGWVVLVRSAFQIDRKTDFGVYARAGYAVRTGKDVYSKDLCDDHGWHYCYPPPLAILMAPLADPFQFEYRESDGLVREAALFVGPDQPTVPDRYLDFQVSVVIWYLLSVGFTVYAIHAMVGAALPGVIPWSRRWWYARLVPAYVCVGGIGYTLSRGQVNLLQLALTAGMFAALIRGRPVASGLWLAGAISLKVIPGYLALYPVGRFVAAVARGEWRAGLSELLRGVAGTLLGLALLLGVLPAVVWGPEGALTANRQVLDAVLRPAATGEGDQTRSRELTETTATDSQSFQAVIHAIRYPDPATRPPDADRTTRLLHWAIGGVMTVLTLAAAVRLRPDPPDQLVYLGCVSAVMLLITPVSHVHYYVMALPLVAGLWLKGLAARPGAAFAGPWVTAVLAGWGVLTALLLLPYPATVALRDFGAGVMATVGLWAVGLAVMFRGVRPRDPSESEQRAAIPAQSSSS